MVDGKTGGNGSISDKTGAAEERGVSLEREADGKVVSHMLPAASAWGRNEWIVGMLNNGAPTFATIVESDGD